MFFTCIRFVHLVTFLGSASLVGLSLSYNQLLQKQRHPSVGIRKIRYGQLSKTKRIYFIEQGFYKTYFLIISTQRGGNDTSI